MDTSVPLVSRSIEGVTYTGTEVVQRLEDVRMTAEQPGHQNGQ
jgi:hypothetical protein